jgi:hypothetical protein
MSIVINVISDNKINFGSLDVNDADLNLIYQLSDIREPDKRKANYVRKFKLPGTKNNNRIFSNIFENGYELSPLSGSTADTNSYNPNLRLRAQVILDNNVFFEGNLQLNKVNKVDNKLVDYEVTIYGSLGDFFGDLGDSSMTSLDISEYNHKLTRDTICYSWNMRGAGKELVWKRKSGYSSNLTFADKIWKYGALVPNDIGDGYVYPLFYQGGADLSTFVSVDKWAPSIYIYTLMKKIFDKWGWKWKSDFLESEMFKRLIIPFSKDSLMITEEQKNKSEFLANTGVRDASNAQVLTQHNSGVANTQTSDKVQFIYDSKTPSPQPYPLAQPSPRDEGNTFDAATGIWTAPKNGQFRIQSKLHMMIGFLQATLGTVVLYGIVGPNVPFTVKLINAQTNAVLSQKSGEWVFTPTVKTSGNYFQTVPCLLDYEGYISVGTKLAVIVETTIPTSSYQTKTVNLSSGVAFNCPIKTYVQSSINDASYFSANLLDKQLQEGDSVNMNQVLPEMGIKEFITGLNKMFNLYWVATANDKEFIIEPRDDLFAQSAGVIQDWTKMVDNGEILSIEPLYDLTANKFNYTYKSASDYLNKDYQDTNGTIYGDKTISVLNDFQFDEQKIETTFSPSPLYTPPFNNGITLTAFMTKDGTKFKKATPKPRILYWGGMKTYTGVPPEIVDVFGVNGTYIMKQYTGGSDIQTFPYAGHLDDTINPTVDLNYGIAKNYYFQYTSLTDNNLYNKYWKSFTEELIDPNQHLLTCKLYLPGPTMTNLDLRSVIQVDNVYYRINKITYNPMTYTAEAELFKLKSYKKFEPSYLTTGGLPAQPGVGTGTGAVSTTTNTKTSDWGIWKPDVWDWAGETPYVWGKTEWKFVGDGQWTPQFSPTGQDFSPWKSSFTQKSFDGTSLPTQPITSVKNGTNTYSDTGSVIVNGEWNIVAPTAKYVTVNGSFNNITDSAKNINIVGDYNTILPNVSNVSIVGNNIVANKSNTSYVDGIEIGSSRVQTHNVSLIKSPTQMIGGVVMGGKNSTGAFSTGKTSRVVTGNAQTTIQPKNISPLGPPAPAWSGLINLA